MNLDGNEPYGTLVFDPLGNLYGTTVRGGPGDRGTVFELTPPATPGGTWTEKAIFSFPQDGTQGVFPGGYLVFDDAGNLYGTTGYGGGGGYCDYSYLGCAHPPTGLVRDDSGNLYGTAAGRRIHDKELADTGLRTESSHGVCRSMDRKNSAQLWRLRHGGRRPTGERADLG